jgi:hypothetical protein
VHNNCVPDNVIKGKSALFIDGIKAPVDDEIILPVNLQGISAGFSGRKLIDQSIVKITFADVNFAKQLYFIKIDLVIGAP